MIDRKQLHREDWQRQFEQLFGVKLDLSSKSTVQYKITLYDVTDTAQLSPKLEFEFELNSGANIMRDIVFINRYNLPAGSKNLKMRLTTKCGQQLSIYPEYIKCYLEGMHEVWTFKL